MTPAGGLSDEMTARCSQDEQLSEASVKACSVLPHHPTRDSGDSEPSARAARRPPTPLENLARSLRPTPGENQRSTSLRPSRPQYSAGTPFPKILVRNAEFFFQNHRRELVEEA